MTEEAKKNLLDYMLGKIINTPHENYPNITTSETLNTFESFIKKYYPELSDIWAISFSVTRGDYIIIFINDYDNDPTSLNYGYWKKTFIVVSDKQFNPIKYIDEYENGKKFNIFVNINDDDSGTGSIYVIDGIYNKVIENKRIVILNDFTLEDFKVRLLNSYYIPKYNNNDIQISYFTKNQNDGKYFMVYNYVENSSYYGGALEFVNNVGSNNEWNFYPYTGTKKIKWSGYQAEKVDWIDGNLEFRLYFDYDVSNYNGNSVAIVVLKSNVDGETRSCIDDKSVNLPSECKNVGQIISFDLNINSLFIVTQTTLSDLLETKYVIEYNINDFSYKIWFAKDDYVYESIEDGYITEYDEISVFSINGKVFFNRFYKYYKAVHDENWNYTYEYYDNKLYLDQIYNDKLKEFFVKDFEQDNNTNFSIYTDYLFNLTSIYLIFKNTIVKVNQVSNFANYNGESFEGIDSLNSNSAILYSDNIPVFARNLYNKTLNGPTTTSTIEIPNNYLNDILIDTKNLLSKNNNIIINDTNGLTKNIYETVFLNFVNTISIVNQNESKNSYNIEAATKLNTSINNPIDYDDLKLTKFRINYQDGTNYISTLQATLQDDNSYQLLMTFYLTKQAISLDLLSEDENTVYLSYNLANADFNNKYYSFKQRVRIGGLNGTNNISRQSLLK